MQEGYCSCPCLSVKSHLTSGASVRPENSVMYSVGNGGQKIVGFSLKLLRCRDPARHCSVESICTVGHFPAESTHEHYSIYHKVASRVLHFSAFIYVHFINMHIQPNTPTCCVLEILIAYWEILEVEILLQFLAN